VINYWLILDDIYGEKVRLVKREMR